MRYDADVKFLPPPSNTNNRHDYLKRMREHFEYCAKTFNLNLAKGPVGQYLDPMTDVCFTMFSTAYQADDRIK